MALGFVLDPKLAADTLPLAESSLSLLRVLNDSRYPWLVLIPKRASMTEWFELAPAEQTQLLAEATLAGRVLKERYSATKINLGALGNIVRQLHVHVVARREGDPAWPGPVWGHSPGVPYSADATAQLRADLTASPLGEAFSFPLAP